MVAAARGKLAGDDLRQRPGDIGLAGLRQTFVAVSPVDLQRVLVLIEHPARTHLVGGHQVEFLALQLFLRVVRQIVGFGGKAGDVELGLGCLLYTSPSPRD